MSKAEKDVVEKTPEVKPVETPEAKSEIKKPLTWAERMAAKRVKE